jgi:hypothetical protein
MQNELRRLSNGVGTAGYHGTISRGRQVYGKRQERQEREEKTEGMSARIRKCLRYDIASTTL